MEGFGNISTKNINELIKKIEQRIALITKNIDKNIDILNNKLSYCVSELSRLKDEFEHLKRDTEIELERLENELEELDEFVNHLYNECIKVEFGSVSGEKVASGIAPLKNWEQSGEMNPIYARYAEKDESGRNIANYLNSGYAASAWIQDFIDSGYSSISATDISGENVTANNLSSNSATLTSVSSTNLSSESAYVTYLTALSASGESALYDNVSSTNVTATNLSSVDSTITSLSGSSATITNITGESATITNLTGTSAEITNISSNALTALTAEGESSKYVDISGTNVTATNLTSTDANITNLTSTDISSTNLTALTTEGNSAKFNEISSTNLTALTASGNSAIFNGISAHEISGNLSGLAGSATKLSSPREISITGDEIGWTVTFDGSQNTAASGQIKKVYWSALSGNAVGSGATDTSGIMTPDQIQADIDFKISQAVAGVYQLKGNASWETLTGDSDTHHNGYVYNVTGDVPVTAQDHSGNRIIAGDNVVWIEAYSAENSWDVLANTTEMTGKLDTTAFTSWSGVRFNETSARWSELATSATTAFEAQKLGTETSADIITRASAGSAAWDWVSAHGDESITAFTTASSTNVDLVITSASGTSAGSEYTLAASGYRTNINPSTYLSASGANEYTSSFGLTDSAETYISEGHEASSWLDSNAHNYISALNVGEQHNASVTTASELNGSGTKYTINVSGYKTIVNPDNTFLSAKQDDEYTSSFGLTDTAIEYISAGYSAWSAVSGLISGGTISADTIIGTTISASSFSADDATVGTISSTHITAVEISANNYSGVSITSNSANVSSLTSNDILTDNITASSAISKSISGTNISSDNTYVSSLNVLSANGISANFTSATINEIKGSSANINYVSAITISSNEYIGNSATISSIYADSASANNLTALTAQGNSANYSSANISELTSDSAFITNLTALSASGDSATFNGISAQEGTISSLYANEISANVFDVSAISSESAVISSFSAHNIDGDFADFINLTGNNVNIDYLTATTLTATTFSGDSASITAISSDYAEIDEISSTFITALSASGNSAIFSGISAQVISGNLSGLAGSATQLSTPRIISASGDATLSDISFDGTTDVTGNIQIHSVNWSALDAGGNIVGSASTETSGIMPPSAINDLINSKVDSGTSGKLDTTAFTSWSADRFDETSARYALSAGSATIATSAEYLGDQSSADVITSATAGSAAYNWLTGNSNIQNIVSSIDTSALHNVALTAIRTTSDSGSNYTLKASGFKTELTTNDWVSGSTESDGYDLKYGLTNKTTDYLNEGHSAWSSVSSLINGDTISANIVKASDGFSGQNISGDNVSSTIDDLIGSAQSGQSAYNWIVTNSAKMGLSAYTTEQIINGIAW